MMRAFFSMGRLQMYTTLRVAVLLTRTPKLAGYCQTNEFVLEIRWSTRYVLQCQSLPFSCRRHSHISDFPPSEYTWYLYWSWFSFLLSLLALVGIVSAAQDNNGKTIVQIVYDYDPNRVAAAVAGSLYLLCSVCLFARAVSNRAWWALCLPLGSMNMAMGFFIRIVLPNNPDSSMLFLSQQLLILLSPAAFLAFNYLLYGQFVADCLDPSYSRIPPRKAATWFVISNLVSSLIQTVGGGLQTSKSVSTDKLGVNMVLAGLAIQTIPFALFIFLCLHVYKHIRAHGISLSSETWGPIVPALLFSSATIMLRCIYRIIEYIQGSGGYLMTHELWLYLLDALPLFIGIIVYIPFWPSKYLVVKTDLPMSNF